MLHFLFCRTIAMNQQDALTISLYSQLFEEAIANECVILCSRIQGTFAKENRRDSFYWYWVVGRDNNGTTRVYIMFINPICIRLKKPIIPARFRLYMKSLYIDHDRLIFESVIAVVQGRINIDSAIKLFSAVAFMDMAEDMYLRSHVF